MSWWILLFAGLFEVAWALGLKLTDGFNRPLILVLTLTAIVLSMGLLAWALKEIPLGTAYAVWTGIGVLGTFFVGVILFNEPFTLIRSISVVLILAGLVGLKMAG